MPSIPGMKRLKLAVLALLLSWRMGHAASPAAAAAPETYRVIKDVSYQSIEPAERADIYLPVRKAHAWVAPAIIWMHGNHHDKADDRERHVGADLATAGYVCLSINYGDWPAGNIDAKGMRRMTQNVINAKNAVRFLRSHAAEYHIDAARIALFGGSAGANLALLAGFSGEDLPPGMKDVYLGVSSAVSAIGNLYGFVDPGWLRPKLATKSVPVLIIHGKEDSLMDYQHSVRLDQLLTEKGVPHELLLLDGIGHGFDFTTWNNRPLPIDVRALVLAFLKKHLGPPAAPG